AWGGRARPGESRALGPGVPEPVAAQERVGVPTEPHALRQLLHQFCVAAAEDHVLDVEREPKALDDVEHVAAPLLLAAALHACLAAVVLVGLTFFVRKVSELPCAAHACDEQRA